MQSQFDLRRSRKKRKTKNKDEGLFLVGCSSRAARLKNVCDANALKGLSEGEDTKRCSMEHIQPAKGSFGQMDDKLSKPHTQRQQQQRGLSARGRAKNFSKQNNVQVMKKNTHLR